MSNTHTSTQRTVADQRRAGVEAQEQQAEEQLQLGAACRAAADLVFLARTDVTDRHVYAILSAVGDKLHDEARAAELSARVHTERAEMLRWHQHATNTRRSED